MSSIVEFCFKYKRGGFKRHQQYHQISPQVQKGRVQTTSTASPNFAPSTRREGSNDMSGIIELRFKYKREGPNDIDGIIELRLKCKRGGSKRHCRYHRAPPQVQEGRVQTTSAVSSNCASNREGEGSNDISGIIELRFKYGKGGFKRHVRYRRILPQVQEGRVQTTSTVSSNCASSTRGEGYKKQNRKH